MNPGPIDEAGRVAVGAIDALKNSPLILALVLLQAFTLAGIAWSIHERAGYQQEERKLMTEERRMFTEVYKINIELLSKCVVPLQQR